MCAFCGKKFRMEEACRANFGGESNGVDTSVTYTVGRTEEVNYTHKLRGSTSEV